MVEELFIKLSLIIVIAVGVSAVMKLLKQPLIIGYIFTGIIVGPLFFNLIGTENEIMSTFAKVGVALLLFTVGLHLNPKIIKEVGKVSLITGIGQVIFTSVAKILTPDFVKPVYLSLVTNSLIVSPVLPPKSSILKIISVVSFLFIFPMSFSILLFIKLIL